MDSRLTNLGQPNENAVQPNHFHPTSTRRRFTKADDAYAHNLYFDTVGAQDVEAFIQDNRQYDTTQKKWSFFSMAGTTEQLVGAVYSVLQSIVGRFVQSEEPGVERVLDNTLGNPVCDGLNEDGVRVCPVLLVRSSGPSFQIPEAPGFKATASSCSGFSNISTYFSVKLASDVGTEREILDEMASYARRIFHDQPNRIFVRSLFITENHARLIHFDRAGSQITPPIDVHHHPGTLIRLVTGLSSTNERLVGLDDSIRWKIVNGRKAEGTLSTTGPSGERTTYPILGQMATIRDSIRGRATTCWRVRDPVSLEEYVVKDSWRPDDRTPEHEFLELFKGIPGVVQMISCEGSRGETRDFRCPSTIGQYHNRAFGRVTMRSYGKPLMYFASVLQLLCALRDAIAAHHELVRDDIRVLHRDISHNNVLLGKDGAPEGDRGVIIDFDMAFRPTTHTPTVTVDHNIGTRVFQSLRVVGSCYLTEEHPPHDYLDDLESFLYLLAYVFLLYRPDGSRFPSKDVGPCIVRTWGEDNAKSAHSGKYELYGVGAVANNALQFIDGHWGKTCSTLFDSFSWWILDREGEKSDLLIGPDATGAPDALEPLLARREEHYAEVLKMFDEAIEALSDPTSGETVPPPPSGPGSGEEGEDPPNPQGTPPLPAPITPPIQPTVFPLPAADPPQDVEMDPSAAKTALTELPTPAPPSSVAQPRRSARIRNIELRKNANQSPSSSQVLPSKNSAVPMCVVPSLAPQPRRSDRIRKRRLDDDPSEVPHSVARPVKKRARVATRSR